MTSRRRVLLVSPAFHGYWSSISTALDASGFEAVPFVYDCHPTVRAKVRTKVRDELLDRWDGRGHERQARDATAAALTALAASRAEAVIVVRGDRLLDDFWQEVADRSLPCTLWLYDELARVPHPLDRLRGLDLVATYSPGDAAQLVADGVTALVVPNAFDPTVVPTAGASPGRAVVFVGARYPGRERVLVDLHAAGIPVQVVGRDWSHHPIDRLRTWQLHRPALPATRDMSRGDAYALMADAPATINLHERQDGFTMRTFEASGVGALQLIDRDDVADLYEPGTEIIPFGSGDELADLCRRASVDHRWHERVGAAARARTLSEHTFQHRVAHLTAVWR